MSSDDDKKEPSVNGHNQPAPIGEVDFFKGLPLPGTTPATSRLTKPVRLVDEDHDKNARADALERSIPPRYRWARFDAPELAPRIRRRVVIAEAQAAVLSGDVLLHGESAGGKTSLAVAMLRARMKALPHEAMLFVRAHRLAQDRIQHPAGHGEAPDVLEAMRVKMILLDGLGEERDTLTSPIADILFERYEQNLCTWVTTGLRGKDIVARYGSGIARRLWEQPRVTILKLDDPKPEKPKPEKPKK